MTVRANLDLLISTVNIHDLHKSNLRSDIFVTNGIDQSPKRYRAVEEY